MKEYKKFTQEQNKKIYDAIKSHIHMTVITYLCEATSKDEVSLSYEHDEYHWLSPEEIQNFDMPIWLKRYFETAILEYSNMKEEQTL